jgi:hypothetical protein
MKKQIFTILCFLCFQETINAQFTLEALNPNVLRLRTNGIDRMAITNGGNFAFGHTAPAGQFHFQRNSAGVLPGFGAFSTVGIFENSTDALMYIITPTTATGSLNFGDTDDLTQGRIQYNHGTDEMSLTTNSARRLYIKSDGKVGIAVANPDFNLEIKGTSDAGLGVTRFGGDSPGIFGRGAGGTEASPTATQLDHTLSIFGSRGHDGTAFTSSRARIETKATQNWTASANGTKMRFLTTPNGSITSSERMVIDNDGEVGIGRATPQAKLDVDGDIILGVLTKEVVAPATNVNGMDREGKSVIRFTGVSPILLSGIAGGVDGMIIYIYNYDAAPLTIRNDNASASNENRIWTGNSADIVFTGRGGAVLVYDGVNLKWRVISYND